MLKKKKISFMITLCAAMIALQIVFERLISISTPFFRLSLTFIPRAITGLCLGIILGGVCSGIADFIGSFLFYASVNPLITLSSIIRGALFGWLYKGKKEPPLWKTILTAGIAEFVCGGVITTIGLIWMNGAPNSLVYWGERFLQVGFSFVLEVILLVLCNRYVFPEIRKFLNRNGFFDNAGGDK